MNPMCTRDACTTIRRISVCGAGVSPAHGGVWDLMSLEARPTAESRNLGGGLAGTRTRQRPVADGQKGRVGGRWRSPPHTLTSQADGLSGTETGLIQDRGRICAIGSSGRVNQMGQTRLGHRLCEPWISAEVFEIRPLNTRDDKDHSGS